MEKIIILDCPPGSPRPGDLIAGVIERTGLELKEAVSKLFGNWVWNYSDINDVTWKKIQPVLKERIEKLYNSGMIRYGSWQKGDLNMELTINGIKVEIDIIQFNNHQTGKELLNKIVEMAIKNGGYWQESVQLNCKIIK